MVRATDYLERRGHSRRLRRTVLSGTARHPAHRCRLGRMDYRRFFTACVAGALTWSALYLTIGALAGASYRVVDG